MELRGIPATEEDPVEREEPQAVNVSRMFGEPVTDALGLCEAVATHASAAAVKLRKAGMVASGANVFVQECAPPGTGGWTDSNWWTPFITATVSFESPTSATGEILPALRPAVEKLFVPGKRYRRAGVLFFGLENEATAGDLFRGRPSDRPASKLAATVDAINARLGRGTVFFAATGITRKWKMKREMLSGHYTTRWDELLVVR